jgi:DnaJ like chaperone protein
MTGLFKWIGAFAGYMLTKTFWGAFFGFLIGGFIDNFQRASALLNERTGQSGGNRQNFRSSQDIFEFYRQQSQRYDFPTMLIVLSAAVMKADGKILKSELNYVKQFLTVQFGPQFTQQHLKTLKSFIEQQQPLPLQEICGDIRMRVKPEARVQLIHYLFGIAQADGHVSDKEQQMIENIAHFMGISGGDYSSVKSMFHRDTESDYKILGVTKAATDQEIKKAYRKLAIQHHPDKVAQMGEEFQKGAKEKFQKVQDAYEAIKKERGFQ